MNEQGQLDHTLQTAHDKVLFTPGPLTTSRTVKQAMLRDLGSRDDEFVALVRDVRRRLVALVCADPSRYTSVIVQGSGTFGVESVLSSALPRNGKLLVLVNGAYGRRMVEMAHALGIDVSVAEVAEAQSPHAANVAARLANDPTITHVAMVHCETTTGILNPLEEVGAVVASAGKCFIVDAMSSVGAIPVSMETARIDFLVSSANKCLEGVPGFSFVVASHTAMATCAGQARTLSLDLHAQWRGLEQTGQFRFTPPTHALLAFHQALLELDAEGGVAQRSARYSQNHRLLVAGMRAMGFQTFLPDALQSPIITAFFYLKHPNYDFGRFYSMLSQRGMVIYSGKLSQADCFRIGHIGRIFPSDVQALLAAVADVLRAMDVQV